MPDKAGFNSRLWRYARLSRVVGRNIARELIFWKKLTSEQAREIGLVNRVYDTKPELISGAKMLKKLIRIL